MRNNKVYLASSSPRRQELLSQIGINFEVVTAEIDETPYLNEDVEAYLLRMAKQKALAGVAQLTESDDAWVIAGDTSLIFQQRILGKPRDAEEARVMLGQLSGQTHQVYSSVAVWHHQQVQTALSITEVSFAEIGLAQIDAYVASGEPLDKAGAYAIQGQAARWIRNINGSYSAVMGLPLYELSRLLQQSGFQINFK